MGRRRILSPRACALALAALVAASPALAAEGPDTALAREPEIPPGAPEVAEQRGPWHFEAGAGLFYDSDVRQAALDQKSGKGDGLGQFDLAASYELPVRDWFALEAGYDFYQSLYFEESDFDLQSHTFHAVASRPFGALDGSLSYLYSLNTLDGDRFLDFHELRPTLGYAPTSWWYATLAPGLRLKRFAEHSDRDADTPLVGTQQLFALGSWERRLLLGIDGEFENADARAFDYRGFSTLADLRFPIPIGARGPTLGLHYCYRHRDYTSSTSSPTGARRDRIHSVRARLDIPIVRYVAFRIEYEYVHAASDLASADYTAHTVGGALRVAL